MGSRVQTSTVCTRELGYTIIVMARYSALWLVATIATAAVTGTPARKSKEIAEYDDYYDSDTPVAVTCPGFPGYCSESYIGDTCTVVCARGRNNVPLCQEDGTWTDIPRCIEHDPGVEEQIPGLCPGIPGYCSTGFINTRCRFDCVRGPDVDSICTQDGTWAPYPTCSGDLRETKDGCDGCPGSSGGFRNRTAEAIISSNTVSDRRVPKIIGDDGGRKNIPSFAGNINIGRVNPEEKPTTQNRFNQRRPTQRVTSPPTQPTRNNQNFQTNFNQRKPQRQFPQRTQQPRQQQSFDQGLNTFSLDTEPSQPLSISEQVKNRINKGKAQEAKPTRQPTTRTTEQPSLTPSQQRIRDRILKQRQQQAQDIANILSQESVDSE